jgi:hypothetical protein
MLLAMKSDRGQISCRKDGYLFVLSRHYTGAAVPTDGTEIDFMITGPLGTHPTGFVVEPVTADYVLVQHRGFECAGSMCCTEAYAPNFGWITPGRVMNIVRTADNVNASFYKRAPTPLTPGAVYIRRGETRAAGLPDLSMVNTTRAKENAAFKKHYRAQTDANRPRATAAA